MARKAKRLTPAQRRAYLAGVKHGRVLAGVALTKKRKAAARKAAATRKTRPKPRAPVAQLEGIQVDEFVLFETTTEGVPILSGLSMMEWVQGSALLVDVELWRESRRLAHEQLTVDPEWETEAVAKTIRRAVRAWYDVAAAAMRGSESPSAILVRLSLQRT